MAKRHKPAANAAQLAGFSRPPQTSAPSYSGDKPNPDLRQFVEANATPYDPATDAYDVPAFNQPIETTKATAFYNMHRYWSKKPHDAVKRYIDHFTKSGDLVLDPFCGSGGTALAAVLGGRAAVAIDRSPAATFITKMYTSAADLGEIRKASDAVKTLAKQRIAWLYETLCDRCGGSATIGYMVFSEVVSCPRCLKRSPLYYCSEAEASDKLGRSEAVSCCPHCMKQGVIEKMTIINERHGPVPVHVTYDCQNGCNPTKGGRPLNELDSEQKSLGEIFDQRRLHEIEKSTVPHWYPKLRMMHAPPDTPRWGVKWRAGTSNFGYVHELYTKRNLWALALIREGLNREAAPDSPHAASSLWMVISTLALNASRMLAEEKRAIQAGTYYLPGTFREIKVTNGWEYNVMQILKAKGELNDLLPEQSKCLISTQSATDLSNISSNTVDYIFTDPPYADKVQYGELNFVWESWLDFDTTWHDEEIIVNEVRGKTVGDWEALMKKAMAECFRVLKPGRWLSLCYHDTSEGTWALIQDVMAEVGFMVDKTGATLFIDAGQKSYNQLTADKATKRDLVLNFRKPKVAMSHFVSRNVDGRAFGEVGREVIRDYLSAHPGATKDRVYDELVSRLVRTGKMEAHDFNALLRSVAEEVQEPIKENLFDYRAPDLFGSHVSSRWYLKETADLLDTAEQAKEDAAAARLETHMADCLSKHPEDEGVHYSDLFEHYLPIAEKDKPRRRLADWLIEYFFKTPAGTWRPPVDDHERQQKAGLRQAGTLRKIKRFAAVLIEGAPIRDQDRPGNDQTLADWIRQCRRSGLYEQGRVLFEKGGLKLDQLGESEQLEVDTDYRICVRRGAGAEAKPRRKRRNTGDE